MKNIAVVAGGNSGEYEVSLRSGAMVFKTLDPNRYHAYFIHVKGSEWALERNGQQYPVDKNDFSVTADGTKITFDAVYLIIHGTPAEDGKFQGYLDMLGIPYVSPGVTCCVLTASKAISKRLVAAENIPTAKSVLLREGFEYQPESIISELGLPCFVKPNSGGSSVATFKIYKKEEFEPAVHEAFKHDSEVLCETFINGTEVTCGIYEAADGLTCLPVTEIVPHYDFFDYKAKYEGESDEITPARISEEELELIYIYTRKIYKLLQCSGLVRVDFIIMDKQPYFMEVNTIPGFSEQSLVPQQIRAAGMSEREVLTYLVEQCLSNKK